MGEWKKGTTKVAKPLFIMAFSLLAMGACAPQEEASGEGSGGLGEQGSDAGSGQADGGPDTGRLPQGEPGGGEEDPQDNILPDILRSTGARLEGEIAPGQPLLVRLQANRGDRIALWARPVGEVPWRPFLAIRRTGQSQNLIYSAPQQGEAHIPWRAEELAEGWEIFSTATYDIVLEHRGGEPGAFQLVLECVGGPCKHDARAPRTDGYQGLQDVALREAIVQDNAGHIALDYTSARRAMFVEIDNRDGQVSCVYTGTNVATRDIPDHTYMNTEHTWPQSRGAEGVARTDLHHLFPTLTEANEVRGSLYFGDVVTTGVEWSQGGSRLGRDAQGALRFEVRDAHKGDVARALFHFAVTYQQGIPAHEEAALRRWHAQDPVSEAERARNQAVARWQNSRNPFVDFPGLSEQIRDF